MTAAGLALLGAAWLLIASGYKGLNPVDVVRSMLTGEAAPERTLTIAKQAGSIPNPLNSTSGAVVGAIAGAGAATGNIVTAAGFKVDASIARNVEAMVAHAARDGVRLTGGGYRTAEEQMRLRRAHCPDPINSPASACSPPTAKVGQSNHQRGLALDLNNAKSRGSAVYQWMAAHAAAYGFKNLPSEPWHWSVDGK